MLPGSGSGSSSSAAPAYAATSSSSNGASNGAGTNGANGASGAAAAAAAVTAAERLTTVGAASFGSGAGMEGEAGFDRSGSGAGASTSSSSSGGADQAAAGAAAAVAVAPTAAAGASAGQQQGQRQQPARQQQVQQEGPGGGGAAAREELGPEVADNEALMRLAEVVMGKVRPRLPHLATHPALRCPHVSPCPPQLVLLPACPPCSVLSCLQHHPQSPSPYPAPDSPLSRSPT